MPNINAALGCAQLENLDKYVASKRKVATEYIEHFKNVDGIDFFAEPENTFSNYWLSAVVLKDKEFQLDFLQQTNDNGVMTRPIWEAHEPFTYVRELPERWSQEYHLLR